MRAREGVKMRGFEKQDHLKWSTATARAVKPDSKEGKLPFGHRASNALGVIVRD